MFVAENLLADEGFNKMKARLVANGRVQVITIKFIIVALAHMVSNKLSREPVYAD
jgi:hypothetical protein